MYAPIEIEIIIKSCNTWRELSSVCNAFDWLIKNDFIFNDGIEKETIRTMALLQVNELENFEEDENNKS